ncbi:transposase family protein [Arthrobacter mobilis]|uniref:Transposase family protein n=1 Tax=Arthrobacter mobilis TaxID=2724944 RepID=A0A7X6K503_9MICC|nr:transposase family protein [Arthrobacter mobilis]NKX55927.1 transposase family protein [Arthrobacter mobilis]
MHVISAADAGGHLLVNVETDRTIAGCLACGVLAVGHGRRRVRLRHAPSFGRPVPLVWAKGVWRCPDAG